MDLIRLENITYDYPGDIAVFRDLNFALRHGQRVGIIGANGSGKTTLFSLIMGLAVPCGGKISLFGELCRSERDFVQARKSMGYLFQDPDDQVFCPTVEEDIAFGPLNLGMFPTDARVLVTKMLKEFGIEVLRERVTTRLSWGQKRLVSLAGVLAMNPKILILDEPTASIDEQVIRTITDHLVKSEYGLLVASHDRQFLSDLDAEIFLMKEGRLTRA